MMEYRDVVQQAHHVVTDWRGSGCLLRQRDLCPSAAWRRYYWIEGPRCAVPRTNSTGETGSAVSLTRAPHLRSSVGQTACTVRHAYELLIQAAKTDKCVQTC